MVSRCAIVLCAVATGAAAQVQAPIHAPGMEEVLRRNQEMYAPYFECTRSTRRQAKLEASVPLAFARYRALGGPPPAMIPERPERGRVMIEQRKSITIEQKAPAAKPAP